MVCSICFDDKRGLLYRRRKQKKNDIRRRIDTQNDEWSFRLTPKGGTEKIDITLRMTSQVALVAKEVKSKGGQRQLIEHDVSYIKVRTAKTEWTCKMNS